MADEPGQTPQFPVYLSPIVAGAGAIVLDLPWRNSDARCRGRGCSLTSKCYAMALATFGDSPTGRTWPIQIKDKINSAVAIKPLVP